MSGHLGDDRFPETPTSVWSAWDQDNDADPHAARGDDRLGDDQLPAAADPRAGSGDALSPTVTALAKAPGVGIGAEIGSLHHEALDKTAHTSWSSIRVGRGWTYEFNAGPDGKQAGFHPAGLQGAAADAMNEAKSKSQATTAAGAPRDVRPKHFKG